MGQPEGGDGGPPKPTAPARPRVWSFYRKDEASPAPTPPAAAPPVAPAAAPPAAVTPVPVPVSEPLRLSPSASLLAQVRGERAPEVEPAAVPDPERQRRHAHNAAEAVRLVAHLRAASDQALPSLIEAARAVRVERRLTPDGTAAILTAVARALGDLLVPCAGDEEVQKLVRAICARVARGEAVEVLRERLEMAAAALERVFEDRAGLVAGALLVEVPEAARLALVLGAAGEAALVAATLPPPAPR